MIDFRPRRIGAVMEPEPGNPNEIEGELNRGAARGADGELYSFPRLIAKRERFAHRRCAGIRN